MIILSLGTDRSILDPLSDSAKRQIAYGAQFDEFNIIIFSRRRAPAEVTLAASVRAYATRSRSRLLYGLDAMQIARKLPKPDVVTAQDAFETGLAAWCIARMTGAKLHIQVHTDFLGLAYAQHSIVNRMRRNIAVFVLRRADRIRVVSNRVKEGIEQKVKPRAPISVLPIFVDIEKYRTAHAGILAGRFSRFRTRFLVVSRLEKEKNVMLALESFAKLNDEQACLIILDEGREKKALQKEASRRGIASRVFFEGRMDPNPYYAVADCILVPSRYEGYGRVIIEALAAGKPVIATDVGIAHEAGAIITDEAHFADAMQEWIETGPREMHLKDYPYQSFEQYVKAYADDLTQTVQA